MESFSATRPCRFCMGILDEFQTKVINMECKTHFPEQQCFKWGKFKCIPRHTLTVTINTFYLIKGSWAVLLEQDPKKISNENGREILCFR